MFTKIIYKILNLIIYYTKKVNNLLTSKYNLIKNNIIFMMLKYY